MPFFLDGNPTQSEVSEAVNYLLSNFSSGITSDPNTGQVTAPNGGGIIGYLYRYMAIKYADSYDGSVNFSNSPTGRSYFGLRNSNDASESSNYADYIWYQASGGFGTTKYIWYITTGGRSIQFAVATTAPDVGWLQDTGASIDLDVLTSATTPVIAESFVSYFTPPVMQVPRTGGPLAPVFTGITPVMYATDKGVVVPFTDAQTDSSAGFVNNSWRIGNSSTTGNGDISYTNITIGSPVDYGDYAQWPAPTAMPNSPAYITVPVRYKNSLGVVSQASVSTLQLTYADPGAAGAQGYSIDISGYTAFVQNAGGAFTPTTATLSAVLTNVTSPTYSWAISGATPTSATTASVVVTPTSSSTGVTATLTVNGSNLTSAISKTVTLPVVYDGAPGTAGANGVMSAFPTIYIWTGSSTPPTRPTTTSTFTWSTGAYTAPSGWSTQAPSNTTPGNYLWSITVPLNASATTTTSTLDWTNTANPIRGIAYNGTNGSPASVLTLASTAQTFTYDGLGNAAPTSQTITFTANLQGLSGSPTFTATKYDASGTNIGSPSLGGSGVTRTLAIADFAPAAYCVVSANLSGYSDTITVIKLQDGTSSTVGLLTNEAVTVAADSSGVVTSFANAGGTFKMYYGATDVTISSAFSVASSSGVTISINASTGVYSVSAMSAVNGTATLQAIYNGVTIQKVYSISKSLAGNTGSSGSATFVVDRGSSGVATEPTPDEVYAVIGRYAVAGDICTVSYSSNTLAKVWRYVTGWITQTTYITGSLIVQNTITSDKLSVSQLSAITANLGTITAGEITVGSTPTISGTTMTGSGTHLYSDGRFVMGNSTTNITFNGTNATLNGFTSGPQSSTTGVNAFSGYVTIATLTLSRPGITLLTYDGLVQITDTLPTSIPSMRYVADGTLNVQFINSSNIVVYTMQFNFGGASVLQSYISGVFGRPGSSIFYQQLSAVYPINLPADTYTIKASSSGMRRDSAGVDIGSISGASSKSLLSNVSLFQVAA